MKVSIKDQNPKISEYWSASELIKGGSKLSFDSDTDATEKLERILQNSVEASNDC